MDEITRRIHEAKGNISDQFEKGRENLVPKKVVVTRKDGTTFQQTVWINPNAAEEKKGEELSPEIQGMSIQKYSDKALIVTGDTYGNVDTMREIKSELGVGTYNRKAKGWFFPIKVLEAVLGIMWSKQTDEEVKQTILNAKNESLSSGDQLTVGEESATVDEGASTSEGTKYNVTLGDGTKMEGVDERVISTEPETDQDKITEIIDNSNSSNRANTRKKLEGITPRNIHEYSMSTYLGFHGFTDSEIAMAERMFKNMLKEKVAPKPKAEGSTPTPKKEGGSEPKEVDSRKAMLSKYVRKYYNAIVPLTAQAPQEIPTAEAVETEIVEAAEVEEAAETEVVDPDARSKAMMGNDNARKLQAELLDMLTKQEKLNQEMYALYTKRRELPENKKYGGEYNQLEEDAGNKGSEAEAMDRPILLKKNEVDAMSSGGKMSNFTDKLGAVHNIPDFRGVDTDSIPYDIDNILNIKKPPYVATLDEEKLRAKQYIIDNVKIGDNAYIVSLAGFEHKERIKEGYTYVQGEYRVDQGYVIMTLDQLVITQDYYQTKAKAEAKKKADDDNKRQRASWDDKSESYRQRWMEGVKYRQLYAKDKKKVSESDWDAMSWQDKEKIYVPLKKYGPKKVKFYDVKNKMSGSFHTMYERFVDPTAERTDRQGNTLKMGEVKMGSQANMIVWESWATYRENVDQKINDLRIQREEYNVSEVRKKALETSWGASGTSDILLGTHGVTVKRQNGDKINPVEVDEIKGAWEDIQNSFGKLVENAREDGLRISHSGEKYMFAKSANGVYIPSMMTIGVSRKKGQDQFSNTFGHEVAHWIDNSIGKANGNRFASDNYDSTAGKIAGTFRAAMNSTSKSAYINSTHECFARAFEQYHAMENSQDRGENGGRDYHTNPNYMNGERFNNNIRPLIDKFLEENKDFFKAMTNDI